MERPFEIYCSDAKKCPLQIPAGVSHIVSTCPVHDFRHINSFFTQANRALPIGGLLTVHFLPAASRRQIIFESYPRPIAALFYFFHYLWKRVTPKLKLTRKLYFFFSSGKNRALPRVEILGRLYRAGFKVVEESMENFESRIVCEKIKEPITNDRPSYGPFAVFNRIGYHGKMIGVYKFRTMYAYSEYIQDYVYEHNGLAKGGKLKDDFRINISGKILRKSFLDELPMFINMFKGECKLVGVRPLSLSYYHLYTPEMQELHISVKPGLIPPFYCSKTPETIEEVQESEREYIESYHQKPFRTDWHYFWGAVFNILFKHKRSH